MLKSSVRASSSFTSRISTSTSISSVTPVRCWPGLRTPPVMRPYEPLLDRAGHTESGGLAPVLDLSYLMAVIYDSEPVRHFPPRNLAVSLGFRSTDPAAGCTTAYMLPDMRSRSCDTSTVRQGDDRVSNRGKSLYKTQGEILCGASVAHSVTKLNKGPADESERQSNP
jgi:hypothetical protein